MLHNEFQRRLEDAHLSEQAMYLLSSMFETMQQVLDDHKVITKLMLELAGTVEGFVGLNERTLQEIRRMQGQEHATVESVRNDPDTEH